MLARQFAARVLAAACLVGGAAFAQNPAPTTPATPQEAQSSSSKPSNSLWQNLSYSQKKALAPLAPHWAQISPAQKNKWLAMSNNFDNLSPREQATLHNRMADWAALSPQQRAQARLSFNETKTLGADQKKSQWEAYQALSQDDRKKLASQQTTKIQGAATASQATSPQKVIPLQGKSPPTESANKSVPIIVIDKKTLLPTTVVAPEGT
jgi:hypothetical protein